MTSREDRFRSLPPRGKLAVVIKHMRPFLDAVQATEPVDHGVLSNLWQVLEIGECSCVDMLDDEELADIDRRISELIAAAPKHSTSLASSQGGSETLDAAKSTVLTESVYMGVRVLLAARDLRAHAYESASAHSDEAFLALLDLVNDPRVSAALVHAGSLHETPGSRLAGIDRDIQAIEDAMELHDLDNTTSMSPDLFALDGESEPITVGTDRAGWRSQAPAPKTSSAGSPSGDATGGQKAGWGFILMLLLSGVVSALRNLPDRQRDQNPPLPPVPPQRQLWNEQQQRELEMWLLNQSLLPEVAALRSTLETAEQALKDDNPQDADPALQAAVEALEQLRHIDTLDDYNAEMVVQLAWKSGDLLRPRNAEQALQAYDAGIAVATRLVDNRGTDVDCSRLAALHNNKSNTLSDLGRYEETAALLSEAVRLQRSALDVDPTNETYRKFLSQHYSNQTRVLLALERWEEAAQSARDHVEIWNQDEEELYESACRLARVATEIRDRAAEAPARDELVQQLVDAATATLTAARGADLNLAQEIEQNESLRILAP